MADRELVIKIPEEMLYRFKNKGEQKYYDYHTVLTACMNGIPLPKGHGRLIDADALLREHSEIDTYPFPSTTIDHATTIIEANKEEYNG